MRAGRCFLLGRSVQGDSECPPRSGNKKLTQSPECSASCSHSGAVLEYSRRVGYSTPTKIPEAKTADLQILPKSPGTLTVLKIGIPTIEMDRELRLGGGHKITGGGISGINVIFLTATWDGRITRDATVYPERIVAGALDIFLPAQILPVRCRTCN